MKLLVAKFFRESYLFYLLAFLLVFIPLYPKIPLFSPIEQYIVRVRLEDLFVFIAFLYLAILLVLNKAKVEYQASLYIFSYLVVGAVSLFSAIFILGSIPQQSLHTSKSLLHFFRYLEYFSFFFLSYAAIKTKRHLKHLFFIFAGIVIVASAYGFGQRYFRFPVYSTMNREYSKGLQLYLDSQYARVPSTFAGHYDFGAFLVITLPILLAWALPATSKKEKYFAWIAYIFGLWGLTASASQSSFIGAFGALGLVLLLSASAEKTIQQKFIKLVRQSVPSYGMFLVIFLIFGSNVSQLMITTIQGIPALNSAYELVTAWIPEQEKIDSAVVPQYENPVPVKQNETTPSAEAERPPDVYVDVSEKIEIVSIDEEGVKTITYEERPRTFSECAQTRGLSLCIRLEALWPQAWKGFTTNPLLGTGYATLNKKNVFHFTEADGTDNNYLRILGETGALGLITFFSTLVYVLYKAGRVLLSNAANRQPNSKNLYTTILIIGYLAGTAGLLVNAVYIDVFAASKVAFTFWAVTGVVLAATELSDFSGKI